MAETRNTTLAFAIGGASSRPWMDLRPDREGMAELDEIILGFFADWVSDHPEFRIVAVDGTYHPRRDLRSDGAVLYRYERETVRDAILSAAQEDGCARTKSRIADLIAGGAEAYPQPSPPTEGSDLCGATTEHPQGERTLRCTGPKGHQPANRHLDNTHGIWWDVLSGEAPHA